MTDSTNELPYQQPQVEIAWHVTIRRMHKWISEPGEKASRPFIVLVTEPVKKSVIKTRIVAEMPTPPEVLDWLVQAFVSPDASEPVEFLPQVIVFDDQELAQALKGALSDRNIGCEYQAQPAEADEAILMFEELIEESAPDFPGLFSVAGFTPQMSKQLFKDIEGFFLSEPWNFLSDHQPVRLSIYPADGEIFIQLMGQAGIQKGVNLFFDWSSLLRMLAGSLDPIGQIPLDGLYSLSFESANMLPGSDLDAIERYSLPIAAAEAYPLPLIYARDSVHRPSLAELTLMHTVILAFPGFVRSLETDRDGDFQPLEMEMTVETILGRRTVRLSYPAGVLPEAEMDGVEMMASDEIGASENIDDIFDDLRSLEAAAADQALADFAEDAALRDAQMLVYRAWRSDDEIERQLLAHQALELSADCADAYILLAEDEAQTIDEAHRHYMQALKAAERQLGKEDSVKISGSYWENFRTRPMLRALEGVANTLVELEKPAESLVYFQIMLELDPNDHLGARYGCLHTLMELQDYQAAHNLLHTYPNELSAYWSYSHALISYIQKGASLKVNNTLRWALQQNPHVPAYLLGEKLLPGTLPGSSGAGDENEAIYYASEYFAFWWQVKGAIDWLKGLNS